MTRLVHRLGYHLTHSTCGDLSILTVLAALALALHEHVGD